MRIIETKAYQFEELDEQTKEKAIDNYRHLGVYDDWYDFIKHDLKEVGIELRSFDIDRASYAEIHIDYFFETCEKIIETHGENCETYKIAERYIKEYNEIHQHIHDDDAIECLDEEYQKEFSEEVLSMLRREYEYMTSDEYVIEMFEANEYEFTEEGKLI